MARSRSIRSRLTRFAQIGMRRRLLLAEAVLWLAVARIVLIAVPFPAIARRLGHFVPPTDPRTSTVARRTEDAALAAEVGWAVTRAARYVPFRAVCLPQAMAARVMLARRDVASVMHFGAAKGADKPLDTHAWLDAAGIEVTGYPVAKDFSEIACFV